MKLFKAFRFSALKNFFKYFRFLLVNASNTHAYGKYTIKNVQITASFHLFQISFSWIFVTKWDPSISAWSFFFLSHFVEIQTHKIWAFELLERLAKIVNHEYYEGVSLSKQVLLGVSSISLKQLYIYLP